MGRAGRVARTGSARTAGPPPPPDARRCRSGGRRGSPARGGGGAVVRIRRRAACAAVVALLALAPLSGWAEQAADASGDHVAKKAAGMVFADAGFGGTGAHDVEGVAAGSAGAEDGRAAPEGFADEVLALDGRDELRVAQDGCVVGFSIRGSVAEVYEELATDLVRKGWQGGEVGLVGCGSFVKADGRYRWLCLTCTQAGDWTSVVAQATTADEGN